MNLRITMLVYMACSACALGAVYLVKYNVQGVQRQVDGLKQELAVEKESLHLLNAEWAYLNRPDRLQRLSDRHLELVPLDSRRMEDISVLPAALPEGEAVPEAPQFQNANMVRAR
jgi:hypothetical protein